MKRYRLLDILGDDFDAFSIKVLNARGQRQVWTRRRLRKACRCVECSRALSTGEVAFGECGFSLNRAHRICLGCVLREMRRQQHDAFKARASVVEAIKAKERDDPLPGEDPPEIEVEIEIPEGEDR